MSRYYQDPQPQFSDSSQPFRSQVPLDVYSAPLKEISRAPSSIESYDGDKELANRERLKEWDKEEEWDEEKERKRKEEKRKQKKKEIRCKEEAPKNDDIERMTRDIKHELNEEEKNIINTNKEKVEEWMKGHLKEIGKERKRSGRTVTGCLGKGGEEEQENWEKKRYVRRQSTRDIEYNKEGSSADDERYEKKKHCKEGPYRHAPSNSWSRGRDKRLGSRIYYKGGDEEGGYRNRDSHKHTARNSRSRTRNARSKSKIRYKEEYEQNEHNKERGSHKNTTRNSRSRIRGNRSRSRTHRDERHERDEYSSEGGSHDRDACDYRPKSRSQGKVKSHPSDISLTPLKPVFRSSRDKRATTNSRAHSQQVRENDYDRQFHETRQLPQRSAQATKPVPLGSLEVLRRELEATQQEAWGPGNIDNLKKRFEMSDRG